MKRTLNIHFFLVLISAFLWGTSGLFVRTLQEINLTQIETVFGRVSLATLFLGVIILFKDTSLFKIKLKDLWIFISSGLFSIILFNFSYYKTMSLTTLSVAAVLLYTAPFFVVLISLFLFGERLTLKKSLACIVAFLGCCFVSGLFDSSQRISGKALFFGLLTGFGYALYTIFGELALKRGYKTLTITFYIFLSASIGCLFLTNPKKVAVLAFSEPKIRITLILMAIFNTVLPYIAYTAGLSGVDASVAPIIATFEPVVATLVGIIFYRESLTLFGIIGIVLVLSSVMILNKKSVTAKANAKINLTLGVLGKREDGYHLVDTIMQSVSLFDTVTVTPNKKLILKFSNREIASEDSISYKAAKMFFETTGIEKRAKIIIKNRIPTGSGMGGGSADAAAVLLSLDRLYKTQLPTEKLEELGLKLGADVPFFIRGGAMRAEGIGEKLTPLTPLKKGYFLLAKADSKPSTAQMYALIDSEQPPLPKTELAINALSEENTKQLSSLFVNSFTSVWKDSPLKKRLLDFEPDGVSLSGSGPTWFAYFAEKPRALKAYKALKKENIECFLAEPQGVAIKFE